MSLGEKYVDVNQPFIKVKTGLNEETTHYNVFFEGIPENFKLVAEKELNETEENRRECLKKLKEALKGESVEDALLLAFLRNKKFNVKKAEAKMRKFIAKRCELAKMLVAMDMEKIETIIDDMGFGILPYRDKHGRVIVYSRPDGMDLDKYSMNELAIIVGMSGLLGLKYPLTTISGIVYFAECRGRGASFYLYYEYIRTTKFHLSTLLSFPLRVPSVEVLNPVPVARWFAKFLTPLLSGKLIGRISFHDGYEYLDQHYSPDILPECFGGTMGPLNNDVYRKKLLDFIKETRKEYS